jgi:adenosine 3'-phospho 5'-phosphosulfate transporter B2
MSSWAQYDALKYVTFPVQTLFKSSKVIPVMLMGKLLHGKSYGIVEYIEASFITAGIALFTLLNGSSGHGQGETQSVGVMILLVYVVADSFTSQWQHRIYAKFTIDSFQMMLGMNLYSLAFTGASLLQSGSGAQAIAFLKANPAAVMNLAMLSTASATGQMFIFYTIKTFGPIIFTIIMITRQMISMGVSCVLFGHALVPISLIGAATVFATLFHRAKRSYTASERKKAAAITPADHDSKPLIAVNQSFNLKSLEEAQDHTKGGNSPGSR